MGRRAAWPSSSSELEPRQTDLETVAKGPPADRAFDADGKPTKAALGFAAAAALMSLICVVVEEKGRRYVTAVVREAGRPTGEVLAENLAGLVAGLKFEKSMRWNESKYQLQPATALVCGPLWR